MPALNLISEERGPFAEWPQKDGRPQPVVENLRAERS